jgi:hypothetical protein
LTMHFTKNRRYLQTKSGCPSTFPGRVYGSGRLPKPVPKLPRL